MSEFTDRLQSAKDWLIGEFLDDDVPAQVGTIHTGGQMTDPTTAPVTTLDITLNYTGSNPKFNPFHGQKLQTETILQFLAPEAEALLPSPVTVGVAISAGPMQDAEGKWSEVIGYTITEPVPIPDFPLTGTLASYPLGTLALLIAKGVGTIGESASVVFAVTTTAPLA